VLIRRLATFFLVFTSACIPRIFAQCDFLQNRVDFSASQVTIEQAIQQLSEQEKFTVNYPSNLFEAGLINVNVENEKIQTILKSLIRSSHAEFVCVGSNALVFRPKSEMGEVVFAGFITDSSSNQPVVSGLIVHDNNWVETDEDGYFQMNVNKLPIHISVHAPGFRSTYIRVDSLGDAPYNIILKPDNKLSATVIDIYDSLLMVSKTGGVNINMAELTKIPSIAGSPGILNSLRFLPSIQSTVEVNGGMVVQGGGKDQNLVLFDGMELYNPMHLFGLFSVFDENSIQRVSFYKNSFPAEYGGRLSSVLDVKSKVGDFKQWNSKVNFNPVLLQAIFHGPIKKDKTSLVISGRRSFTDFFPLFYEQIQRQNELSRFKYYFYDLTTTVNHKVSDRTQMYLTGYLGGDKGYIRSSSIDALQRNSSENQNDFFVQSNMLATGGVKTWISNTLSLHAKIGYTRYGFNHENLYDLTLGSPEQPDYFRETRLAYQSKISDWKTGVYLKTLPKYNNHLVIGMESVWHSFAPSNSQYFLKENDLIYYDTTTAFRDSRILEQRYFIQDVYAYKGFRAVAGVHYVNFDNEITHSSIQPRVNLSFNFKTKNKLDLGYAQTSQFMLQVPNNLLGIPIDIWIPADEDIDPMHCTHYSLGYTRKLNKRWVTKLDVFYKSFDNIIEYRNGVSDFIAEWDEALLRGTGRSRGVEYMLKKEKGRINGLIGYSLSKSERSIPDINDGEWFPFQYDRRHDIKCVVHYQLNKNLSIGGTWSYASGNYLTAPEIHYLLEVEGQSYLIEQYGNKNNLKLPAYHRLDLGVHHRKNLGSALQTWSFTIYNVYDRQNVFYVNSSLNETGGLNFQPVSILPILPSVNYSIEF
jgi:hypothetical protein